MGVPPESWMHGLEVSDVGETWMGGMQQIPREDEMVRPLWFGLYPGTLKVILMRAIEGSVQS
jgi:hypothetical protein